MKMKNVLLNLFNFFKNKKGQELPLKTIIATILAVLALIIMALILSGTSGDIISKFKEIINSLISSEI